MDGNTIENVELAIRTPLPSSASSIELRNTEDASVTRPYDNATSATDTVHLDESTNPRNEINLAPVDGGIAAWSVLAASIIVEIVVWSFPFAFGFFLSAYLEDPGFTSQRMSQILLPLTGTLSTGIMYCSGALLNPIMKRYPHRRRIMMWCGGMLCGVSLLGASYATKVYQLVFTQGCMFGIGGALAYYPVYKHG